MLTSAYICTSRADSTSAHNMNTNRQLSLQPLHNQLSTQIKRQHALLILVVAACPRAPECEPRCKPMSYVCHIMSCACVNDFFSHNFCIFHFFFFWQDVDVQCVLLVLQLVRRNERMNLFCLCGCACIACLLAAWLCGVAADVNFAGAQM